MQSSIKTKQIQVYNQSNTVTSFKTEKNDSPIVACSTIGTSIISRPHTQIYVTWTMLLLHPLNICLLSTDSTDC